MYCCMPTQHTKALPYKNAFCLCVFMALAKQVVLLETFLKVIPTFCMCVIVGVSLFTWALKWYPSFVFLHIPDFSVFWEPFVCFSTYYWWMWAQASLILLYLCNCREYVCSVCHDTSSFFIPAQVWPMRNSSVSSHLLLMWMKWNHENHTGWER